MPSKTKTDYSKMSGGEMLADLGTDAEKWAEAFVQFASKNGGALDAAYVQTWFATAMMAERDWCTGQGVTVLPDGSAFVVG